jgi:hypothetical protein
MILILHIPSILKPRAALINLIFEEDSLMEEPILRQTKRIRIREFYRAKYRKKFATEDKPKGVIPFLNTSFGLFLLSTVFIGCFSWGFNAWTNHVRESAEAKKSRQKLSLELRNRLQYIEEMETTFPYDERRTIETALYGFDAHANVNPSWIRHYGAVFPEYEQRSLISIVWELETLSDSKKRDELRAARQPIEKIRTYLSKLEYAKDLAPNKNPEGVLETFSLSKQDRESFEKEVLVPLAFAKDAAFFEKP